MVQDREITSDERFKLSLNDNFVIFTDTSTDGEIFKFSFHEELDAAECYDGLIPLKDLMNQLHNENKHYRIEQEYLQKTTLYSVLNEAKKLQDKITALETQRELLVNGQNNFVKELQDTLQEVLEIKGKYEKENKELKELLNIIATSFGPVKEDSVKELLRRQLQGLDSVAGESAGAWHDYCILNNFFKNYYGENWDNY